METRQALFERFGNSLAPEAIALLQNDRSKGSVGASQLSVFTIQQLLNMLKMRDASLQDAAATALAERIPADGVPLAQRRDAAAVLLAHGGLRNLMALLVSPAASALVLLQALRIFEAVLSFDDAAFHDATRSCGALRALVRVVGTSLEGRAQLLACRCLERCAGVSELSRAAIVAGPGLRTVQEQLSSSAAAPELRRCAARLLALLVSDAASADALLRLKALRVLVPQFERELDAELVQSHLRILDELTSYLASKAPSAVSSAKTATTTTATTTTASQLVQQTELDVVSTKLAALLLNRFVNGAPSSNTTTALVILANVSALGQASREALHAQDCVSKLLPFLTTDSSAPCISVIRIFASLFELRAPRQHFLALRGFESLLQLLLTPSAGSTSLESRTLLGHAALLLFRLIAAHELTSAQIVPTVTALARTLQRTQAAAGSPFQLVALRAVRLLCYSDSGAAETLQKDAPALEAVCAVLSSSSSAYEALVEAAETLAALVAASRARAQLAQQPLQLRLVVCVLVALLTDAREALQLPVLSALLQIAKERAGVDQLLAVSSPPTLVAQLTAALPTPAASASANNAPVALVSPTRSAAHERVLLLLETLCGISAFSPATIEGATASASSSSALAVRQALLQSSAGLQAVFESLVASQSEKVQLRALVLLASLAGTPAVRARLEDAGIVAALQRAYQQSSNVRQGAALAQPFAALVAAQGLSLDDLVRRGGQNRAAAGSFRGRDPSTEDALARFSKEQLIELLFFASQRADFDFAAILGEFQPQPSVPTPQRHSPLTALAASDTARAWVASSSAASISPRASVSPRRSEDSAPPPVSPRSANNRQLSVVFGVGHARASSPGAKQPAASNSSSSTATATATAARPGLSFPPKSRDSAAAGTRAAAPRIGVADLTGAKTKLRRVRQLLESGVSEPSRLWQYDAARWQQLLQTLAAAQPELLKVLYELVNGEGQLEWTRVMRLMLARPANAAAGTENIAERPMRQSKLETKVANALTQLGVQLKRCIYAVDSVSKPVVEYELAILPSEIPPELLLKGIIAAARAK